jgi:hypothetical protein
LAQQSKAVYLADEWSRAAIGYSLGALLAAALVLLENIHVSALHFFPHFAKPYPSISSFKSPYGWFAFGPGLLVLTVAPGRTIVLAVRSCVSGVASCSFAWPDGRNLGTVQPAQTEQPDR